MKKKLLALTLALAVLMGLFSPALAAEENFFTDEKDITHLEAVTSLVRLGVMTGKEDGSYFDPKGTVTRGEAAKYFVSILSGGDENVRCPAPAQPSFPDIKGHWAESWIEYCAEKGVAFAQEDGNFDPNGLVGKYELLRMVEAALGYNDGKYDLTGSGWIASTVSAAFGSGLYDLLPELEPKGGERLDNDPLSRDEVAYILYGGLSSAPYLGTETRTEGSTVFFDKKYVLRPDGTPSTLLREHFGYDSWDDVPALPAMGKGEEQKPKPDRGVDPTAFADAKDIQYWQAVASLARLGVVNGKDDGAFHPAQGVTRAEAAKLIAVIMNGGIQANTGVRKEPTFTDIQGHWAEGWIEYCADMGIVSGAGDGSFDPEGEVTVIQLYKMALAALGYDPVAYGLMGSRWADMTMERARNTGGRKLTEGLANEGTDGTGADQSASREVAAQILYNALLATPMMMTPDISNDDGTVTWKFQSASQTLLRQRFDLKEPPTIPAQPTT